MLQTGELSSEPLRRLQNFYPNSQLDHHQGPSHHKKQHNFVLRWHFLKEEVEGAGPQSSRGYG